MEMTWGSSTGGLRVCIDERNQMDTIEFTRKDFSKLVHEQEVKGGSHLIHSDRWMLVPMVMNFIYGKDPHLILLQRRQLLPSLSSEDGHTD